MFDWKKPSVQMLGRFQPWHEGHTEIFKRCYETHKQVVIMVRTMEQSSKDPFSFDVVRKLIIEDLNNKDFTFNVDYVILEVPNIVDIGYGRDVGYTFTEHKVSKEIEEISATKIRETIKFPDWG